MTLPQCYAFFFSLQQSVFFLPSKEKLVKTRYRMIIDGSHLPIILVVFPYLLLLLLLFLTACEDCDDSLFFVLCWLWLITLLGILYPVCGRRCLFHVPSTLFLFSFCVSSVCLLGVMNSSFFYTMVSQMKGTAKPLAWYPGEFLSAKLLMIPSALWIKTSFTFSAVFFFNFDFSHYFVDYPTENLYFYGAINTFTSISSCVMIYFFFFLSLFALCCSMSFKDLLFAFYYLFYPVAVPAFTRIGSLSCTRVKNPPLFAFAICVWRIEGSLVKRENNQRGIFRFVYVLKQQQ